MAWFSFYIGKSIMWRGQRQGFGNLYHFELPTENPSEPDLDAMLDALKAAEVPVHSPNVQFDSGRAWGPVNAQGKGGRMVSVRSYSGNGTAAAATTMYLECAWLCVWPLGRYGVKNRPQFLRKWIHSNSLLGESTSVLNGDTKLTSNPASLITYMNAVRQVKYTTANISVPFGAPSGHASDGSGQYVHKYLEHRQFG